MRKRKYRVRFSSVYVGIPAPRPIIVEAISELEATLKALEIKNLNDEAFRCHVEEVR